MLDGRARRGADQGAAARDSGTRRTNQGYGVGVQRQPSGASHDHVNLRDLLRADTGC